MNAIERSERRVRRFVVLKNIEKLEQTKCAVCPVKFCEDPNKCKICPVFRQIGLLGEELSSMCERKEFSKITETPSPKYEQKIKMVNGAKRPRVYGNYSNLTKEAFIAAIVKYEKISVLARKLEVPETTVRAKCKRWGLKGITPAIAKEMMRKKEVTT